MEKTERKRRKQREGETGKNQIERRKEGGSRERDRVGERQNNIQREGETGTHSEIK